MKLIVYTYICIFTIILSKLEIKQNSENPCYNLYDFDYESSQMIIFI